MKFEVEEPEVEEPKPPIHINVQIKVPASNIETLIAMSKHTLPDREETQEELIEVLKPTYVEFGSHARSEPVSAPLLSKKNSVSRMIRYEPVKEIEPRVSKVGKLK